LSTSAPAFLIAKLVSLNTLLNDASMDAKQSILVNVDPDLQPEHRAEGDDMKKQRDERCARICRNPGRLCIGA
jgi:hypothetical protein